MPEATENTMSVAQQQAAPVQQTVVAPKPRAPKPASKALLSHADSAFFGLTDTAQSNTLVLSMPEVLRFRLQSVRPDTLSYLPQTQAVPTVALEAKPLGSSPLGADTLWIFGIVVFILAIMGIVKARTQGFFGVLFSSLVSDGNWRTLRNSADLHFFWPLRITRILAICLAALMLYEVLTVNGFSSIFGQTGVVAYALVLVSLVAFYWLRNFVDYIIGYAFDSAKTMNNVLQAKGQALSIMSVVVLPLVLAFPFVQDRFYGPMTVLAIIVATAGAFMRLIRMVQIISINMVSLSYYILYLCAVEIAPLMCLLRLGQIGVV